MNLLEELVEKLQENTMNQLRTKGVASYDILDIVKLCVAETAKYINEKGDSGNWYHVCRDLISQCEVNHAK